MSIYREIADIQTQETLQLPRPEAKRENIYLKPSKTQEEFVKELGERAEKIRKREVNPKEDNMLKITNDGKKLALDQRLINPLLEDYTNSKINIYINFVLILENLIIKLKIFIIKFVIANKKSWIFPTFLFLFNLLFILFLVWNIYITL